jgi:membrane protein DedA with SNARE-associated domain
MINEIETAILAAAQTLYDAWGWFGVAVLLILENATGITSSEIILGLAGWMLIAEHQQPPSMILLGGLYAATGSVLGASITYWAARLGGRPLLDKFARWLRIDLAHITCAEKQFQRWGTGIVLVGRVIPGIRILVSIPAGLARMPFITFFIATLIGTYIWSTLLIGVGYVVGHEWVLISPYLKQILPLLFAGGAIALLIYFWRFRRSSTHVPVCLNDE